MNIMSLVLRRSYSKFRKNVPICNYSNYTPIGVCCCNRSFSDDKMNYHEFSNSTILIENGYNVQELPIIVRKLKDINDFENLHKVEQTQTSTSDSLNYHLIQAEFQQCLDLRDVFSLITKCSKITPNIALGAIERIYELEKNTTSLIIDTKNDHISVAKGAILDKLLKVVIISEDTNTILNILKTESSIIEPHKHTFCDELLSRVIDNKLTLEQLCDFTRYLISNNLDPKYSETIDKLWVGFTAKENEIDENNISLIFKILPGLKSSKRTILVLLEQKLSDIWNKIKVHSIQDILAIFLTEKYVSLQSFAVISSWLYMNIHTLDEDAFLDLIAKLTQLNYTDDYVEKAVHKYMKHKGTKTTSYVLIVGILNYCMKFQIRNEDILNVCSHYILVNINDIPTSFLKCFVYPYGYLNFHPSNTEFWIIIEKALIKKIDRMKADDLSSIALSFIYCGKHPLQLVKGIFSSEYLIRISNLDILKQLHLIDTALSLECPEYPGPLLPKDHWLQPITQDNRVKSMLDKIKNIFVSVVGGSMKISYSVLVPNFCSDQTYVIDIMVHSSDLGKNLCNLKLKSMKDQIIAILVHLPDHYCSDNETLVGPQALRIKHLRILGMKVASLKYSQLSQFYTLHDKPALNKYLKDCINKARPCL